MEKVIFYEKGINQIQERYDFVKHLIIEGKYELAVSVYHDALTYLQFMFHIGLIDYGEFARLFDAHHDNFDILFGI